MMPTHTVCASKESGVGPKNGDKPPEKYDLAAVPQKQILTDLEPQLTEADIFSVSRGIPT
jgi:hypothetical protein